MDKSALILAPFSSDALEALREQISVTYESWTSTRKLLSPEELIQRINQEHLNVLIVEADFVFEEVFCGGPSLEFLGVCRNSVDHIDVDAATENGVCVVNSAGRNATAVAELTLGLMLCLARGIPASTRYVAEGDWEDPVEPYICMRGSELGGKTLGILGLGVIGRAVAKLSRAFGMKVVGYDPYLGSPGLKVGGTPLESLETVLGTSDYVSVHTPDTAETQGLLNMDNMVHLKQGAYIINTASYGAIEEGALVEAIRSGQVAGAAMDVHRTHPLPPNSPLNGLKEVLLTPHIGGATDETIDRQSWMMVEDIQRYLRKLKPRRLVNPSVWRRSG